MNAMRCSDLSFCNVIDNHDEVLRRTLRVANDDAACSQGSRVSTRHFNFIITWIGPDRSRKCFAIGRVDPLGILGPIDLDHCLPDNVGFGHLEHRLNCAVHQHKLARYRIFHDDCDRNIFDDGIQNCFASPSSRSACRCAVMS